MTPRRDEPEPLATQLSWMRDGTALFAAQAGALDADALRQPSALPGWTQAHIVAHVARNADAIGNLLSWARTGVETPMYESAEQREADIETSAAQPPDVILRDFVAGLRRLEDAVTTMPEPAWSAPVRTARGRTITAAEIPWLRTREVWIHAIDLDVGATVTDVPATLTDALIDETVAGFSARDGCPQVELVATDGDRRWEIGRPAGREVVVTGPRAALLGWLIGREHADRLSATPPGDVPELPAWL